MVAKDLIDSMSNLPENLWKVIIGVVMIIIGLGLAISGVNTGNFFASNPYSIGFGVAIIGGGIFVMLGL